MIRIFSVLLIAAALVSAEDPKPKAFLRHRTAPGGYYIAVYPDPPVDSGAEIDAQLFTKSTVSIPSRLGPGDAFGSVFTIEVNNAQQTALEAAYKGLTVTLRYPTQKNQVGSLIPVTLEVLLSIDPSKVGCRSGLVYSLGTAKEELANRYTQARSAELVDYTTKNLRSGRIQKLGDMVAYEPFVVLGDPLDISYQVRRCLTFNPVHTRGTFRYEISLAPDAPLELRTPLTGKVDLKTAANVPTSSDTTDITKRKFEKNLDAAVQFSSSVDDVGDPAVRTRVNKGTLDLRLAPLLNVLAPPTQNDTIFKYWTPISINARVSTGSITKATISTNRIDVGSDFEFRKYPARAGDYPNFARFILSARNSSDRDFKQAEVKGVAEFDPVLGFLDHPLAVKEPQRVKWQVNSDDNPKDMNEIPIPGNFGWQVLPQFGVEFGRTYRNHQRLATELVDEAVRRFYFGGSVRIDITKRVDLTALDQFYVRGEKKEDRLHNYVKTALEFILPEFSPNAAHSVFISFERGNLPPFTTHDANAAIIGYRVQWDHWTGQVR